jgi:chromosome segregation ATPase
MATPIQILREQLRSAEAELKRHDAEIRRHLGSIENINAAIRTAKIYLCRSEEEVNQLKTAIGILETYE